jgi:hypothetical protein
MRLKKSTQRWSQNGDCPLSYLSELVDFGRQDEVALGEPIDFVGPDCDLGPTPTKADIGMMTLFFREIPDSVNKLLGFPKVSEAEGLFQVVLVHDFPSVQFCQQVGYLLSLKRRYTAATGDTLPA